MQKRKGATVIMVLLASLLTGFGIWEFHGVGISAGESEHEHGEEGHERGERRWEPLGEQLEMLKRIAAEHGGRIVGVESEQAQGRRVLEMRISDDDGDVRELVVDPATGQILQGGR